MVLNTYVTIPTPRDHWGGGAGHDPTRSRPWNLVALFPEKGGCRTSLGDNYF